MAERRAAFGKSRILCGRILPACAAALLLGFSAGAHAEWVVGGQAGRANVELRGTGGLHGALDESGGALGVFAQRRHGMFGWHAGLGANFTQIDGRVTSIPPAVDGMLTGPGASLPDSGYSFQLEAGLSYDLLGMLRIARGKVTGVGMLGFSALEFDARGAYQGGIRATGVKFAGGFELPFAGDRWVFQLMYEHADLGEIDITGSAQKLEVEQSGFRFRIGTRF